MARCRDDSIRQDAHRTPRQTIRSPRTRVSVSRETRRMSSSTELMRSPQPELSQSIVVMRPSVPCETPGSRYDTGFQALSRAIGLHDWTGAARVAAALIADLDAVRQLSNTVHTSHFSSPPRAHPPGRTGILSIARYISEPYSRKTESREAVRSISEASKRTVKERLSAFSLVNKAAKKRRLCP